MRAMTRARSKLSAHLIWLAAGGGEEGDEGDDHVLVAQSHRLRDCALINIINKLFMIMITDHSYIIYNMHGCKNGAEELVNLILIFLLQRL